jgi:hypothetical protein
MIDAASEKHGAQRDRHGRSHRRQALTDCEGKEEAVMDIHEHQAKEILARLRRAVPRGGLAYSPEQAAYRARELGGERWVVKAQIHSGGRGEAGGVKVCRSRKRCGDFAPAVGHAGCDQADR